jgi:hypothetical protein
MAQRGAQPLELQAAQFVDAGHSRSAPVQNSCSCRLLGHHGALAMLALLPRNMATTSPRWLLTFMS